MHARQSQAGLPDAEHAEEEAVSVSLQATSTAMNDSIE